MGIADGADSDRRFGIAATLEHVVGAGTFASNDYLRQRHDYVGQSWMLSPRYSFDAFGHKLSLSGRLTFGLELTTPNSNPPRRFKPRDTQISLADGKLFHEPLTDITVSGGISFTIPSSYESINRARLWGASSARIGAKRAFGPVSIGYSFVASKFFHTRRVGLSPATVARAGEAVRAPTPGGDPALLASGYASSSFGFGNSVSVGWQVTEQLSLSYALMVTNAFGYRIVPRRRDELTASGADAGRGRMDMLAPMLGISYSLNDVISQVVDLPVKLAVAGGVAAMHPAQSPDNKDIIWPVFVNAFGRNRAANNYGSFYFDLTGTY